MGLNKIWHLVNVQQMLVLTTIETVMMCQAEKTSHIISHADSGHPCDLLNQGEYRKGLKQSLKKYLFTGVHSLLLFWGLCNNFRSLS